ncbi:hypothetical protein RI129_000157 [Pyrocoelia pectoralis]|uniref:Uncharacterized protein n=1 Tax=Pyrocoelia pectoralis TaxID=417401 RepID=A0AAN7V363_9COLE
MLSEYKSGYNHAQKLWKEVEPLYKLLHEFVRIRIQNYYKISYNYTSIPVYLLGSNFGEDWSNIANIVLANLKLYEEIREALKGQRKCSASPKLQQGNWKLGLGALGKQFWKKSNFSQSNCKLHLFSNCAEKYTEILTCDKVDLTLFMDIHESAIDIVLRNQDYSSLARRELRFSAVDEALRGLGSIIALDSLSEYGFMSEESWTNYHDQNDRKNMELIIHALRVLPKLPYYLLSDVTRLDHLESRQEIFTEAWWRNRMKLQGVQGISNEEVDYLGDPFITLNKPRLSEYLGIFLQFQLLDYYKKYYYFENGNIATFIKNDENFRKFVQDRPNKDWVRLLEFHYAITEISSESLLNYFKPLQRYLKEVLLEPIPTTH